MVQVKKKIAVVGAGLSGLAAALVLARAGCEVRVFEQGAEAGGRASRRRQDGFSFDLGPSLLMMPEVLEEAFTAVGARLGDHLRLLPLAEGSRYHLGDGRSLMLGPDPQRRLAEVGAVDPPAAEALEDLLRDLGGLQRAGMAGFIRPSFPRLGGLVRPQQLGYFARGMVVGSYAKLLRRRLGPGPLAEALGFLALYLGMDPRSTPAVFSVLLEAELVGGLFHPEGGMHAIPRALQALAEGLGVRFEFEQRVVGLRRAGRQVEALQLAGGGEFACDGALLALDWATAKQRLLGEALPRRSRSGCSAFVLHLGVRGALPALGHHSVVLPPDFSGHLDALKDGRLAEAPAWYVCKPTASDPQLAPPGHEQLYVLIPTPHEGQGLAWEEALPRLRAQALQGLRRFGLEDEGRIVSEAWMGPPQMREAWGLHEGAAFGLAHGWGQMGPFRPGHGHPTWQNLAFAGASTHPGNGIPMVLLSGRQAAEALLKRLGG